MGKKVSVRITVAPADWQAKREELEKEHNSDGARTQLLAGWLQWLGEATCQTASARVAPASLATPVINDDVQGQEQRALSCNLIACLLPND